MYFLQVFNLYCVSACGCMLPCTSEVLSVLVTRALLSQFRYVCCVLTYIESGVCTTSLFLLFSFAAPLDSFEVFMLSPLILSSEVFGAFLTVPEKPKKNLPTTLVVSITASGLQC